MASNEFRVIIVGAGPVGLYVAHSLSAANIPFVVLEQQPSVVNYFGAMVFTWPHTVRLLDQIGLYEAAKGVSVPIHAKKRVFGGDGSVLTTSNFWEHMHQNHGYPFLPILRSDVVKILYESLPNKDACVKTNAEVVDIGLYADEVHVHLKDGSVHKGSIVIGADGVHSKTRTIMQRLARDSEAAAAGESPMVSTFYGIVARAPNDFGLEEGVFFESRGGDAAIQCTVTGGMLNYATLKRLPETVRGRRKYAAAEMEEYAKSLSDVWVGPGVKFSDVWARTDKALARMLNQEEGFVDRWSYDRIVLLGDAVHKMTSINGLGLTCGLHSAAALANELQGLVAAHGANPSVGRLAEAFARYRESRRGEARQIFTRGFTMIREVTRKSWANWFWDSYVLPWIDTEAIGRGLFVSLMVIRSGQVLAYVPFEGKHGAVPWLRRAGGEP
ncbi:hypothetical protein GGS23DRAFT_612640 [Durotheca rogersii]|uniref:uncharacterized protein n=1 Tax=Durotheca rogersii TaxID=419775 RepID=UPI00221E5E8A|nr:uncharacterized protein GGS23DRAFT_612640 [Durotheca rogersii]KAI5867516.1 hypothetical protein GGS23DRAFT_612640 [Durotheca rogersii]